MPVASKINSFLPGGSITSNNPPLPPHPPSCSPIFLPFTKILALLSTIILILADDLGFNDVSLYNGGAGDGNYKPLILTVLVKMALLSLTVMLQAQVARPLERQL